MKRSRILTVTWVYAVLLLTILIVSVTVLSVSLLRSRNNTAETIVDYTYVYVTPDSTATEEATSATVPTPADEEGWIMKAYSDRIGIFKKDGTLLYVLDTYIKNLPEADRVLLGEGIPIETKSQLYSLIEDYTE